MVYPFARHADGTKRKWIAGTEGVRSQRYSGYTKNEGACDHCQQVASDKDLLRLMHVALGGLQKKQTSLCWALSMQCTLGLEGPHNGAGREALPAIALRASRVASADQYSHTHTPSFMPSH